jgi:hypothetical protein
MQASQGTCIHTLYLAHLVPPLPMAILSLVAPLLAHPSRLSRPFKMLYGTQVPHKTLRTRLRPMSPQCITLPSPFSIFYIKAMSDSTKITSLIPYPRQAHMFLVLHIIPLRSCPYPPPVLSATTPKFFPHPTHYLNTPARI